jgi:uncharacterized membrane protein
MSKPATTPPHNQRGGGAEVVISAQRVEWSGPLPHPEALARFDQVIPNGAERIMQMTEKEQAARLDMARLEFRANTVIKAAGAFALLLCIAAAMWSIYMQADWKVTTAFLGVPLLGAIGKLISGAQKPPGQ